MQTERRSRKQLQAIVETIATHGNRGIPEFIDAFSLAKRTLDDEERVTLGLPVSLAQAYRRHLGQAVLASQAPKAIALIKKGLKKFVPGYKWFDATAAVQIAFLTAE